MSLWHSPQVAESMKKFDGIIPPTLVFAEDGKNGDCGPPPSPCMVSGGFTGLTMRCVAGGYFFWYSIAASGNTSANTAAAGTTARSAASRIAYGRTEATPIAAATMCAFIA